MALSESQQNNNGIDRLQVLKDHQNNEHFIKDGNLEENKHRREFITTETGVNKSNLTIKEISDPNISFLRAARSGDYEKLFEFIKTGQVTDLNTCNANGLNALHLAAKDGYTEILQELLRRGADVDCPTKKGNTALHIASLAGQKDVVKLLIQYNANVNAQSLTGFTPLYMAAQENHDSCVRYLIAKGANPLLATEDGFTPLAVAMQQGHEKVVTVLMESDSKGKVRLPALHIAAKKDDINTAALLLGNNDQNQPDVISKSGFTPLHIAAHYGNSRIARLLIEKGANVNYTAKHNITPLHVACKWGKFQIIDLLIANHADIYAQTRDGLTPLHCAARSGHSEAIKILLNHSATVAPTPNSTKNLIQSVTKNGLVPLHMAAQGEHDAAALILLKNGACVDDVTVDYLTALHVAAHCGHVKVAKLLLAHQANPNARALNGFTPLHIACKKNRIKIVELLLKHNASISATTESGLTPLHVAAFMGCMNVVIYLLQHDADPDSATVRGETPLHLATRAHQTDIIRILLRNGSEVDCKAGEGQTSLHVASRLGNFDIAMLLLQHGASVDAKTRDLYTPLHIAAKEDQADIANILIEQSANLEAQTSKGFTPLHLAAKYGNCSLVNILIQKGANINAQNKNGLTVLHVATHYGRAKVAQMLLEAHADPNLCAKNGHTALHIAARKNQFPIAANLLQYSAKPNLESKCGFTPLHLAAQEGNFEICQLLLNNGAVGYLPAKNGLTPMHLCAQANKVDCAKLLLDAKQTPGGIAKINEHTKAGYTPLHIAAHFGNIEMIQFLLENGANHELSTNNGYTPLHQAAQQGHIQVINVLLSNNANPDALTANGQTPLCIASKLGYVTAAEVLKTVTEPKSQQTNINSTPVQLHEEKLICVPEKMHEVFISDSEDEGCCSNEQVDQNQYIKYMTNDHTNKNESGDSDAIFGTRFDIQIGHDDTDLKPSTFNAVGNEPLNEKSFYEKEQDGSFLIKQNEKFDNTNMFRQPPINVGFLVSFLVDARGGAMRGCRHSGVHIIVSAGACTQPTRITCRYVKPSRIACPPPLMEGEALVSRILELSPAKAKFLRPVVLEVPHFGSLRNKEREIIILRSDNGEMWREHVMSEHTYTNKDDISQAIRTESQNNIDQQRIVQIVTNDFPHFFAIVSRIRQEVHGIGPDGGTVSSKVIAQVQAIFPPNALTKKIRVGLQAQPVDLYSCAKLLGQSVAVSPVVTVEPRRRKFHKAITLSIPAPRTFAQGMGNNIHSANAANSTISVATTRLLCSITGGQNNAIWEDVTGSTPLQFINQNIQFTTTVSARFWLIDCRNIQDASRMATELYQNLMSRVPFYVKFVLYAKRITLQECRLSVFCMTDDKEDKTLENQDNFTEIAKSCDLEVLEGQKIFVDIIGGNIIPIAKTAAQTTTKTGQYPEQLNWEFNAFRENRLSFLCHIRVDDEITGIVQFLNDPKYKTNLKFENEQPICQLKIDLSNLEIHQNSNRSSSSKLLAQNNFFDQIVYPNLSHTGTRLTEVNKEISMLSGNEDHIHKADIRLIDISKMLKNDWQILADELNIPRNDINLIKYEYPNDSEQQCLVMLMLWLKLSEQEASGNSLERALINIGRKDIVEDSIFNVKLVTDDLEKSMAKRELQQTEDIFKYLNNDCEMVATNPELYERNDVEFVHKSNKIRNIIDDADDETTQKKLHIIGDSNVRNDVNEIIDNSVKIVERMQEHESNADHMLHHPTPSVPLDLHKLSEEDGKQETLFFKKLSDEIEDLQINATGPSGDQPIAAFEIQEVKNEDGVLTNFITKKSSTKITENEQEQV